MTKCLNCGSSKAEVVDKYKAALPYTKKYFKGNMMVCKQCDLYFLSPLPSAETLKEFYTTVYRSEGARHYVAEPHKQSRQFNPWARANAFWKLIYKYRENKKIGKICDIGAGWGYFLLKAIESNHKNCIAIETDENSVTFLKKQNIEVIEEFLEGLNEKKYKESFDIISLSHVLEHITDLKFFLKKIKVMLQPNGLFIIEIPNCDYSKNGLDGRKNDAPHISFFSKEVLEDLLKRVGFKVLFCDTAGITFNKHLSGRKTMLHKVQRRIRRILVNINEKWGNPEMYRYGENRVFIRAIVKK